MPKGRERRRSTPSKERDISKTEKWTKYLTPHIFTSSVRDYFGSWNYNLNRMEFLEEVFARKVPENLEEIWKWDGNLGRMDLSNI